MIESEGGKLLTVPEVATELRQSRQSVYRHIARGQLHALTLGNGPRPPLRVRAGEVQRFLSSTTDDDREAA